jgi:hypothetical protein
VSADTDPPPLPDGAADRLRVASAQRLLHWATEAAPGWAPPSHGAHWILLSLFARSTRTYEAVVRWLAEHGFGEQGLMLDRSLFEDMMDARWISLNPDLAVERLAQHDRYSQLLRADVQNRFRHEFGGRKPPSPKVTPDERKQLRDLFGKSGGRSWTGVDNDDRLKEILPSWKSQAEQDNVRFWFAWAYKLQNETLHPSGFSIGRLGGPTESGNDQWEFRFGSTPTWLWMAISAAVWAYTQTLDLMIDELGGGDHSALNELWSQVERDLRQASHWEKTGRLEQLPEQ